MNAKIITDFIARARLISAPIVAKRHRYVPDELFSSMKNLTTTKVYMDVDDVSCVEKPDHVNVVFKARDPSACSLVTVEVKLPLQCRDFAGNEQHKLRFSDVVTEKTFVTERGSGASTSKQTEHELFLYTTTGDEVDFSLSYKN